MAVCVINVWTVLSEGRSETEDNGRNCNVTGEESLQPLAIWMNHVQPYVIPARGLPNIW